MAPMWKSRLAIVSVIVLVSTIMVLSPLGQPLRSAVQQDLANDLESLGYSFQAIFPSAVKIGPASPTETVDVGLSLPMNDPSGLASFIQSASTPGSSNFHHFLTPSQFTASYAPSESSYRSLASYFAGYGVSVQTEPNRLVLSVSGSPSAMGAALHTTFYDYRMPKGQVVYGPASAPQIPAAFGVTGAYGFTNALDNVPANLVRDHSSVSPKIPLACASPIYGGDTPTQIRTAYGWTSLPGGDTGAGMKIAIVDGYDSGEPQTTLSSDLSSFDSNCAVGAATVSWNYPVPSTTYNSSASSGWGGEEDLDLQWSHTMGPGATIEMTFSPNAGVGLYQAVDWIVSNSVANDISLSWGEPDVGIYSGQGSSACSFQCNASTDGSYAVLHPVIEAAAAEGISVFVASGDCGSADGTSGVATDYPASDEDSTGVGGTTITLSGNNYGSESVWSGNLSGAACNNGGGAGGGWAPTPQPWYQHGYGVQNKGLRGVPDVGITAGTFLVIYSSGSATASAGTSDAAPMWAGITAVADQVKGGGLGLLNPTLYSILRSTSGYNASFHDVSTGTGNGYPPNPGWNPITGIGTPKIDVLVPALATGGFNPTLNPLTASISASTTSGSPTLSVTFTASASGGTGKFPLYDFNFGDGNATAATTTSTTYQYTVAGSYAASVEVYDSSGNSTQSTHVLISVGTAPFSLTLSASTTSPTVGQAVTFTAAPTGGTAPYTYQYTYGDGLWTQGATSATSVHSYRTAGTYCAQVTGTDSHNPAAGAASNVVTVNVGGATGSCTGSVSGPSITSYTAQPSSLPLGHTEYLNVTATGGTPGYTYAYAGLPAGCTSSSTPFYSCVPTATGPFTVTVTVTDSASKTTTGTANFTVTSSSGLAITSFTAQPSSLPLGHTEFLNVTATGGTTPYSYAYTGLPAGCTSFNTPTYSCVPTATGPFTVTVTVTDKNSNTVTSTATFTVTSSSGPTITSFTAQPASIPLGNTEYLNVTATGGTTPYSYVYAGLPAGCTSSNTATYSCVPSGAGTFSVTVTVTDKNGNAVTSNPVSFTVTSPSGLSITSFTAQPSSIPLGSTEYLNVTATGGTTPYSYAYTGLPAGCTSSNTPTYSCIPSSAGASTVTVTVTDKNSNTVTGTATFTVTSGPTITSFTAQPATIPLGSTEYLNVTATGGTTPYSYVYAGLPAGCTSSSTATYSCVPSGTGTSTVTVTVTDKNGNAVTSNPATFTVSKPGGPTISTFTASPTALYVEGTLYLNTTATGGSTPYTYVYNGLPSGCTSSSTPAYTCTPTAAASYSISVTVTDKNSLSATSNPASVTVKALPAISAFTVSPQTLFLGGTTYLNVTATGSSTLTYAYSGLPSGCASANSAKLTCVPAGTGTFSIGVTVTDTAGNTASKTASLTVNALPSLPTITAFSASPQSVSVNQSTTFTVVVSGGTTPYTYAYTNLPTGCSSRDAATLPCVPTVAANYVVTVTVTDTAGHSASRNTYLNVSAASTGTNGNNDLLEWMLIAAIAAIAAAVILVMVLRHRKGPTSSMQGWQQPGAVQQWSPPPPPPPQYGGPGPGGPQGYPPQQYPDVPPEYGNR